MADITEEIPLILPNETPLLTDPVNFSIFTDNYHLKLASIIDSINIWSPQANAVKVEINATSATVSQKAIQVSNDAQQASDDANIAESAKNEILNYAIPTEATYNKDTINTKDSNVLNATIPHSGYTAVSKKLDNFVFEESVSNIGLVHDKNMFIKFGGTVVDTHTHLDFNVDKGGMPIDFSNDVPDVTIQDQVTNGNILTTAVAKDDYVVVDKKNFVTNGTFDSDTNGWTPSAGATLASIGGVLSVVGNGTATFPSASQVLTNLVIGTKYSLSFEIVEAGSGITLIGETLSPQTGAGYYYPNSIGKYTVVFTATSPTRTIVLVAGSADTATGKFDNIVVEQAEGIFRAKQNALIGTDINVTTFFEPRPFVSNKALASYKKDTVTNAWRTSTEVLYTDVYAHMTTKGIMLANGFSEVSHYLYSKGTDLVIPVGTWDTGNKGLTHRFINEKGYKKASDNKFWHDTSASFTSIADCFDISKLLTASGNVSSGVTGNEQGKYFDVVYSDDFTDRREYAKLSTSADEHLLSEDKILNSIDDDKSLVYARANHTETSTTSITNVFGTGSTDMQGLSIGDTIEYYTSAGLKFSEEVIEVGAINGTYIRINANRQRTQGEVYTVIKSTKSVPIQSSDDKLLVELIGSPANYPNGLLSDLTLGKEVFVIPNLIDVKTELSNFPNGAKTTFLFSKKVSETLQVLKSADAGTSWSVLAVTTDYTINLVTNEITFVSAPLATDIILISNTTINKAYKDIDTTGFTTFDIDDFVIASNSDNKILDSITSKIAVGTDDDEKLSITKVVSDIVSHTPETITEDALYSKTIAEDTDGTLHGGLYNSTVGSIDKTTGYLTIPLNIKRK